MNEAKQLIDENDKLQKKIEFYEAICKKMNAIIHINKVTGVGEMFTEWTSAKLEETLGYTTEELKSYEFHVSIIHPDDLILLQKSYDFLCKNKGETLSFVYRVKNKAGKYIWMYNTGSAIEYNEDGTPMRVLVLTINMGEQLKFQNQVQKLIIENKKLKNKVTLEQLTKREKEVMVLIAQGLTMKKIAEKLTISQHTVNTYRKKLLEKTKKSNSAELAAFTIECGLLE